MSLPTAPARQPRWFWIPVRVLAATFLLTLLSFAVSLLLGILGIVIGAKLRGVPPNLSLAYRLIAVPVAATVAAVVLVASVMLEVRQHHRARTLAGIERASK
jgi:hypothetical protein